MNTLKQSTYKDVFLLQVELHKIKKEVSRLEKSIEDQTGKFNSFKKKVKIGGKETVLEFKIRSEEELNKSRNKAYKLLVP